MATIDIAQDPAVESDHMQTGREVVREVRDLVRDLMTHHVAIYWADFCVSYAVASSAIYFALTGSGWVWGVGVVIAAFAMYRLSVFTHEIAHMGASRFKPFRVTWDILFGVPALMPSFLYGDHKSHHVNHSYGTAKDGEYFPLAHGPFRVILVYFGQVFLLPIGAFVRFAILGPVSLLAAPVREIVWQRFSGLVLINPKYRRMDPKPKERLGIYLQELGSAVWCWSIVACVVLGLIPWQWLMTMYVIFVIGASMNFYRALGSHRYVNKGEPMSYQGQLLDSTTVEGVPVLTELAAPLGMRYHALHHLVPSLPYHAMGKAHRRLMKKLPSDSPYRDTLMPSITSAVVQVACRAWRRGDF